MALSLFLMAACVPVKQPAVPPPPAPTVVAEPEPEWRKIASTDDIGRIERLSEAWTRALAEARTRGFRRAMAEEKELLDPHAALARPEPTPGPYKCRVIKLGTQGRSKLAFNSYKSFFCYVEADGDLLTVVKQTGSQRPAGRLYPDNQPDRMIFLGTVALGTEDVPLAYGENAARNMTGVMERVGPFRFRLVIPWPQKESKLDVIELVPVPPSP